MNTQFYRSCKVSYGTQGNLALAPQYDVQAFSVIEGGRRHRQQLVDDKPSRTASVQAFRMNVFALGAFLSLVVALMLTSALSDALIESRRADAFADVTTTSITVRPGDCLLGIAEAHPVSGCSASEVASWIKELNGLDNATILAGQPLLVPSTSA